MRRKRISGAGRLWQSIARNTRHHEADRRLQRHAMTNGNIHRAHSRTGAQRCSDNFPLVVQRRPGATHIGRWFVRANQQRFCASDRGEIGEDAKMGSNTATPGVGKTVTITDQQIRRYAQAGKRVEHSGRFTEREVARDIREVDLPSRHCIIEHLQRRKCQHDNGCERAITTVPGIDTGNRADRSAGIAGDDSCAYVLLNGPCLCQACGPRLVE